MRAECDIGPPTRFVPTNRAYWPIPNVPGGEGDLPLVDRFMPRLPGAADFSAHLPPRDDDASRPRALFPQAMWAHHGSSSPVTYRQLTYGFRKGVCPSSMASYDLVMPGRVADWVARAGDAVRRQRRPSASSRRPIMGNWLTPHDDTGRPHSLSSWSPLARSPGDAAWKRLS
jgi:hypothetical protein